MLAWKEVEKAKACIARFLVRTPLLLSESLSEATGLQVYLKLENLQRTGAFKIRGALNKVLSMPRRVCQRGLICASTGNHGKGLAYLGRLFGFPVTVVVSENAPAVKVDAIRALGAQVLVVGKSYAGAEEAALALSFERNLAFIHSFDDPLVIAGQATIAWEVVEEVPDLDALIVPVGGGALLAGSLVAANRLSHRLKVIGVEATGASALQASLQAGQPLMLSELTTLADGMAVCKPGKICFEMIQKIGAEMTAVDDEEMSDTVVWLLKREKVLAELAGAASVAAILAGKVKLKSDSKVACVVSGGNIDHSLLAELLTAQVSAPAPLSHQL